MASVVSCCHAPPILETAEHDLDPVAPFVAALVLFYRRLALLSNGYAGAYPLVFRRFSEPVGVGSTIPEQPVHFWQAAQQRPCTDVVADLTGGDEQVQRTSLAVADGVQLRVSAALRATDQTSTPPPFLTLMLVAVRCALR